MIQMPGCLRKRKRLLQVGAPAYFQDVHPRIQQDREHLRIDPGYSMILGGQAHREDTQFLVPQQILGAQCIAELDQGECARPEGVGVDGDPRLMGNLRRAHRGLSHPSPQIRRHHRRR